MKSVSYEWLRLCAVIPLNNLIRELSNSLKKQRKKVTLKCAWSYIRVLWVRITRENNMETKFEAFMRNISILQNANFFIVFTSFHN